MVSILAQQCPQLFLQLLDRPSRDLHEAGYPQILPPHQPGQISKHVYKTLVLNVFFDVSFLNAFRLFCDLFPQERLYIFARSPTNSTGWAEQVSDFNFPKTRRLHVE